MSATNRGAEKSANDAYYTPPSCTLRFLERYLLPGGLWLEPCAGEGAIIQAVNSMRTDVTWVANELDPKDEATLLAIPNVIGVRIGDARELILNVEPVVSITNPPFSVSEEILRHLLAVLPRTLHIFLQRTNWAEGPRAQLFREIKPSVYLLPQRPSFKDVVTIDEKTGKARKSSTDATSYSWFVFDGLGKFDILDDTPDGVRREEKRVRRQKEIDSKKGIVVEIHHAIADATRNNPENVTEALPDITFDLSDNQEGEQDDMSNLPSDLAEEVAKARTAGGGSYIQHGSYIFMIKKWFYQKIQDRCIILELITVDSQKKIVSEGSEQKEYEPNPFGSEVSSTANFDGDGKLSAPGNARAPILGLFNFKENEVPNATVQATLDEVVGPNQPALGMILACSTFPKEIRSRKGSFITGLNWENVSKPGEGINAPHLVQARIAAMKQGSEAAAKLAAEHLAQFRGTTTSTAPASLPAPATTVAAPPAFSAPTTTPPAAFAQPTTSAAPPPPPAPPTATAKPWLDGWQPNPAATGYFYRYVNGAAEQKTEAEIQASFGQRS